MNGSVANMNAQYVTPTRHILVNNINDNELINEQLKLENSYQKGNVDDLFLAGIPYYC
jgi:hypothetical protein